MKFLKTQVLTVVLLLTSVAAWGQEVTCPELNQVADQGELKACLDSNNVQTIVIIGDFEITPVTIYRTVTIKSDATTRTLTRAAPGSLFFVDEGAALTLENIIIDGGGENITGANGPLVDVNGAGRSLEMRAGTVLRNNVSRNANAAGGAVLLRFGASFTMNGGEISGNTATWGGGVVVWTNNDAKSTFIMNGGIIRNNEAKGDGTYDDGGGGVIVENSIFVMNGGEISGNFANQTGGGVTVSKSSTFTLGGTAKIFGNTLANKTTASNVYLLTQDLYITLGTGADGTSIPTAGMNVGVNTVAANNGIIAAGASSGAEQHFFSDDPNQFVVWEGNQLKLAPRCPDGSIVNNHPNLAKCIADYATATNNMTINIGYDFNVTAPLSISGNSNGRTLTIKSSDATTRTLMRGAAATGNLFTVSANASLIFENLVVDGNKGNVADIVGSLVMVNGNFEMKAGAVLRNNTISGYGSGVHVSGGTFTMHGGEISGNTTSTGGGGMYANSSGTFIMHGGTISGNKAAWGGGVNVLGTFTMNGGTVYGNEAEHGDLGNTATGGGASILVEGTAQAQYGGALASY
ncbi:MAG: hypothetical protein LBU89_05795, partial [Fibromonadaceae bacterium]|nr:hypothetical protein [Fibromonadaceae bacterium]